ncbi:uncharacterized protein LOC126736143 [Anthonomus grandis grandis]|uniref:uncharacterized protein LOC126736143 n=1 Tax=Anthonomus grandis grandis TaxID=2921223 RepID=UPI0021661FFA|nr:uncharacterized protein LOC126736143 [Anthonomus grandis grandis]
MTAYHPAANGMIERWHRCLKAALKCHNDKNWTRTLSTVLLGLRSHVRADTEASPAEFLFGTTLRMPGEFFLEGDFTPDPRTFIEEFREFMRLVRPVPVTHNHKRRAHSNELIPYKVVKRPSDRVFDIDINGKTKSVSVELLKPAYLMSENLLADTLDSDPPLTTPSSLAGTQDLNGAGNSPVTSSSLAATHDLDGPGDLPVPMVKKVLKTYARKAMFVTLCYSNVANA